MPSQAFKTAPSRARRIRVIGQLPAAGGGRKMTPALAAGNAAGQQADLNPTP
jgi:hypothetical protein